MDGLEATRRIRSMPQMQHTPIITISASSSYEEQGGSIAAGANAFMTKPVDQAPSAADDDSRVVAPSPSEMDVLYRLAMVGNMRDICRYAAYLAQLDERYRPFADKLQELAKKYQSKAIVTLVNQHADGPR